MIDRKQLQYKFDMYHVFSREEIKYLMEESAPKDALSLFSAALRMSPIYRQCRIVVAGATYLYFHGHGEALTNETTNASLGYAIFSKNKIMVDSGIVLWGRLKPTFESNNLSWE